MDIEAQIEATACLVVEVDAAVTQVKVDPRLHGVVDRALQPPIAVGGDAKPADIAKGGQPEPAGKKPAGEVDMISSGNQRIDPAGRTIDARSRQNPEFKLTFAEKPQARKPTPKSAYWPDMSRMR